MNPPEQYSSGAVLSFPRDPENAVDAPAPVEGDSGREELGISRPSAGLEAYPPMLFVNEVAEILRVNEKTVRNLIKRGELPGEHVGRRILIPKRRLMEMFEKGEEGK